ncbi:CRISPR-associated endonuclease Cas2 [Treponema pedis]|uniref:CRISPR-associated endoribonuclease Cas2 n=4 Tax=Treponema pedis TaxID=409322 RepID=S6A844_9SPIR|nr:CRISPR-associated endonuclease Cas2 [Treponema pedis]AGT43184.1 CRISPR-associated protein Cas2 [Treponema pedis str. T A4]QOW60750.1 CRISPR-associated endonuclease Cas2 [Treponema pedis]
MEHTRFNAYKIMWIICLFDLPTNTKEQRHRASKFRQQLIEDGFSMMQFSVYYRHCGSAEACAVHVKYIKKHIPREGKVSILRFTDKQFGEIESFIGKTPEKKKKTPSQLEFF